MPTFVGILILYKRGHTFEFDHNVENNNWDHAEKFCERAGGHADVWYATNIEVYDYVAAYKSLIWGADGTMVYNPTNTEICFASDNARESVFHPSDKLLHVIKPGETRKIVRG